MDVFIRQIAGQKKPHKHRQHPHRYQPIKQGQKGQQNKRRIHRRQQRVDGVTLCIVGVMYLGLRMTKDATAFEAVFLWPDFAKG